MTRYGKIMDTTTGNQLLNQTRRHQQLVLGGHNEYWLGPRID